MIREEYESAFICAIWTNTCCHCLMAVFGGERKEIEGTKSWSKPFPLVLYLTS
jgi:hypothetical protein